MPEETDTVPTGDDDRCRELIECYLRYVKNSRAIQLAAMRPEITADDNALMHCQTLSLDLMDLGNKTLKLISIVAAVGVGVEAAQSLMAEIDAEAATVAEGFRQIEKLLEKPIAPANQ